MPGRRADLRLGDGLGYPPVHQELQVLGPGVGPVNDHRVRVVAGLARRAVAGDQRVPAAARRVVQRLGCLVQPVDILHHVELAGGRPAAARPDRRPQRPERRPVAAAVGRIRLLDRRGHLQLAAGRRLKVVAGGLDPRRRPGAPAACRLQHEMPVAVQVDVLGRVGGVLDLTGPVARADVIEPVARRRRGPGSAAEAVAEHGPPARRRRRHGRGLRLGDGDRRRREHDIGPAAGEQRHRGTHGGQGGQESEMAHAQETHPGGGG